MSELEDLQSRLKVAEQKAKDAESMMFQAAEYGRDLLEKNMSLESSYEDLMQEKHELNLKLQVKMFFIFYFLLIINY